MQRIWGTYHGPDDEDAYAQVRRYSPPTNEVPVVVPLSGVAHRTEELAVFLRGATVYSTGFEFDVCLRASQQPARTDPSESLLVMGPEPRALLLGVTFPDGRRASTLDHWVTGGVPPDAADIDAPLVTESGSGGVDGAFDAAYWLSPVPHEGVLRIVVAAPALDLPETEVEVDAGPLGRAAAAVQTLWPWQPPDLLDAGEPPLPDLAPGGWFAARVAELRGD